jgi:hypothetical protein
VAVALALAVAVAGGAGEATCAVEVAGAAGRPTDGEGGGGGVGGGEEPSGADFAGPRASASMAAPQWGHATCRPNHAWSICDALPQAPQRIGIMPIAFNVATGSAPSS